MIDPKENNLSKEETKLWNEFVEALDAHQAMCMSKTKTMDSFANTRLGVLIKLFGLIKPGVVPVKYRS